MNNDIKRKIAAVSTTACFALNFLSPATAMAAGVSLSPETIENYNEANNQIVKEQIKVEKQMQKELKNGEYTLENPYVVVNPYGSAPLSAYVMFKTEKATWASVLVKAKEDSKYPEYCSIRKDFKDDLAKSHVLPIYGLYDGFATTVTITLYDKNDEVVDEQDVVITGDEDLTYKNKNEGVTFKSFKNYTNEEQIELGSSDADLSQMYMMDKYTCPLTSLMSPFSTPFNTSLGIVGVDLDGEVRMIYDDFYFAPVTMRVDKIDKDMAEQTGLNATGHATNHFLTGYVNSVTNERQSQDGIVEFNPMGKFFKIWNDAFVHHEFIYNPTNDSWITDLNMPNRDTVEDYIREIDYNTGEVLRDWDVHDLIKLTEYKADSWQNYDERDWAHVNSLTLVRNADGSLQDAIVFSPRHKDGLYKANLDTNELEWFAATPSDDANYSEELKQKALTPVITLADGTVQTIEDWWKNNTELNPSGADLDWNDPRSAYFTNADCPFEYTFGQHAVSYLPNGDLFVYDNGNARSKSADTSLHLTSEENYSRAVIYHIDEENGTIEQVWQYGKEAGNAYFSRYICDVDYIDEGHYIIDFGGAQDFTKTDDAGKTPNHATVVEIKDGEVIYALHAENLNAYRTERVHLYQDGEGEVKLGEDKCEILGEMLDARPLLSNIELPDVINVAVDGKNKVITPIITDNWNEYSSSGYVGVGEYDYTHPETSLVWNVEGNGSIDEDGEISASETGVGIYTATLYGGYNTPSASCSVNVVNQAADVSDAVVQPGDSVKIPVVINGNDGINGFKVKLNYDKNTFSDVKIEAGDFDENISQFNPKNGELVVAYSDMKKQDGVLFNIILTASDNAQKGEYEVSANFVSVDGDAIYANKGQVSVGDYALVGDISGDGVINNADVVLFARYLVGLEELSAKQIKACDINADGEVDVKDLVVLSRMLVDLQ